MCVGVVDGVWEVRVTGVTAGMELAIPVSLTWRRSRGNMYVMESSKVRKS